MFSRSHSVLPIVALCMSVGCDPEPLCLDDDPLPTGPVSNVRLELRGADIADRPVLLQDSSGLVVQEGVTDANGVFVVASTTADAALSVELGPTNSSAEVRLVTYLGLASDETLMLDVGTPEDSGERATVTVTFDQIDDPTIDHYSIDLGANCGNSGWIEHAGATPTHVIPIQARCPGVPSRAVLVARDVTGRVISAAGAALDLAPDDAVSIVMGPWQTDSFTLGFVGDFPEESRALVSPTWDGRVVSVDQHPIIPGGSVRIPAAPSAFNGVKISVNAGNTGVLYEARHELSSFDLAFADFPPPITDFDAANLDNRGAPRLSWRYDGDAAAVIGFFRATSNGSEIERSVLRGGNPCHIDFPTLPARYAALVPTIERELTAAVILIYGPSLDTDTARRRVGPFTDPIPDAPFFIIHDGASVDNFPPDR